MIKNVDYCSFPSRQKQEKVRTEMRNEKLFVLDLLPKSVVPWQAHGKRWGNGCLCRYTFSWFTRCSCGLLSPTEQSLFCRGLMQVCLAERGESEGFLVRDPVRKDKYTHIDTQILFGNVLINAMSLNAAGLSCWQLICLCTHMFCALIRVRRGRSWDAGLFFFFLFYSLGNNTHLPG